MHTSECQQGLSHPPPTKNRAGALSLSLVIPVHNEEACVQALIKAVDAALSSVPDLELEFVFVDDGSTDNTLERLQEMAARDARICLVELMRNFGKEAALSAGLRHATGTVVVPIDADLQDPPEVIPKMITLWRQGFDVVVGHRSNRDSDSPLKRWTARAYYWLHNKVASPHIPADAGDFRLMDRSVVEAVNQLTESRRFMKGLFAWVGGKQTSVDYVRAARTQGSSKFNGWRLLNFAVEGITSFSILPLRLWTYLGCGMAVVSMLYALFITTRVLLFGRDVPGYASLLVAVIMLGGIQLIGIGVLGEYLGRTYLESKNRPCYLLRNVQRGPGRTQ